MASAALMVELSSAFSSLSGNPVFSGVVLPLTIAFICTITGMGLMSLPLRRLPSTAHWSEMARLYWPLRSARTLAMIWIVMAACSSSYGKLKVSSEMWLLYLIGISALAGCILGAREAARGLPIPVTARPGGAVSVATWFLLFPSLPGILLVTALTVHRGLDSTAWFIAGGILLACLFLSVGGSVTILRATGLARSVDGPLEQTCREMAITSGVSMRHVMSMDLGMANAFAFPWTRDMAFTRMILTTLDEEELRSVISHEIGHLAEGRAVRWKRLVGLLAIPTIGLAPGALIGGNPLTALGLFATYFFISRWTSRHHKQMEIEADSHAGECQSTEGVYARSLEKIHAAGLIPAVLQPGLPYPNLYDRMTDAGVTPDFPRPAPPSRWLSMLGGGLTAIAFLTLWQWLGV
jgi:Zn-dependent protease with chaperone function